MADHIPFISSAESLKLATRHYRDSEFARIPLDRAAALAHSLPSQMKLWLDPSVDGMDDVQSRCSKPGAKNPWFELMQQFASFEQVSAATFWSKPDKVEVDKFVTSLLNFCAKYKPTWLTVPQLPFATDSSRNKINLALARATGAWRSKHNFSGKLILPLIFTHQDQVNGKTERNPKVKHAGKCYHESQSDGFWVVDKSLTDDSGSKTLRNSRFPGIVDLHTELNQEIPSRIRIAGPYWGLNMVLWARGLVDYPAIGVGNSYQFFLAGSSFPKKPVARIAIGPLRRRVIVVAGLSAWLESALKILGMAHPAYAELTQMRKQLPLLSGPETSREQVAKFYKSWFDLIASTPQAGRSLGLFQDLSAAYALGRTLPELEDEETSHRPESVAEPLMLNCL